jgi:hypothetical protein
MTTASDARLMMSNSTLPMFPLFGEARPALGSAIHFASQEFYRPNL